MDELIFAGNKYISSKRAGKLTGYTTDYIGQMCRGNKIDCRLIGRNWYINERVVIEQRKSFKKEQFKNLREIEYKKIELEPMYYSNDWRLNNPEINKEIFKEQEIEKKTIYNEDNSSYSEELPIQMRIIKKNVVDLKNYQQSPAKNQTRVSKRRVIASQIGKNPQLVVIMAVIFILIGFIFTVGTLTLEQSIHYSSGNKTDIDTNFQLANSIKSFDFGNIKRLFNPI